MRRFLLLSAGAAILAASPAPAEEISRDYDETFPVKRGMRLVLAHGDGDVVISPWDRDEVHVVVEYQAEVTRIGWGSDMKFEVEFTTTPDEVRVIGRESGFGGVGIFTANVRAYTYTISAPPWLGVETVGEDGDLEIEGWEARLDLKLEDGDLDLERIRNDRTVIDMEDGDLRIVGFEGDLDVRAEDGDVNIADCRSLDARFRLEDGDLGIRDSEGRFEIEMDDGDLDLLQVRAEELRVDIEDGDVTADLLDAPGMEVEISGGDGRVDVRLAENASTRFSVRTRDGRISLDVPDAPEVDRRENHASGILGDGDGNLRVTTSDGPVTLRVRS